MSDVESQVKNQVEFYFGDSNFRRDRFLQEETKRRDGGFVPFSVLFTFKKLAALTTDGEVLQRAICSSDVVEMNEEKNALRRKHPLPDEDDSARRTLVLSGLGMNQPTIDEIKAAFAPFDCELLYIGRRMFQKRFNGVAHVEFKTQEGLERALAGAEKICILNHYPSVMRLTEYKNLSRDEQIEFEKSIKAMLVAKQVPSKPTTVFLDELLVIWKDEPVLRPRVKYMEEQKELYLLFTQVAFAQKVEEVIKSTYPIVIDDQKLQFELVTDKDAIAKRPRKPQNKRRDGENKRKREAPQGKAIHISNIGNKVRIDDIKQLLATVMDPTQRSPYVEFDGLDQAKFVINDSTAAEQLFEKLSALEKPELGGQKISFHLLEPHEELKVDIQYERGLIVRFEGVEGEVSRDDIKNVINEKLGEKAQDGAGVAFIKYQKGTPNGELRLTSAELAKEVIGMITQGDLVVNDCKITQAKVLDGEEEKKFWEDARAARSSRFKQTRNNKRSRRG